MAIDSVSIGTKGWANSTGGTPDNTRMGSFGWADGWITPSAVEIIPIVSYLVKRKKQMDAQHIPALI